jgi:hypothetical protein
MVTTCAEGNYLLSASDVILILAPELLGDLRHTPTSHTSEQVREAVSVQSKVLIDRYALSA